MPKTADTTASQRRWTWPGWPSGLYEDAAGFHWKGRPLSRRALDRAIAACTYLAPALVSELADEGTLDLRRDDMADVVAAAWSATENAPSALSQARWVELFRTNGFTIDGKPASPMPAPVRLYRGTVPLVRFFGANRRLVETDDRGRPVRPKDVAEVRDTRVDLAWTSNKRQAERYARYCLPWRVGDVYVATVDPEHILAVIGTDFIVDPSSLSLDAIEEVR